MDDGTTSRVSEASESRFSDCLASAEWLNRGCACITVDRRSLQEALTHGDVPLSEADILAARPHLFSDSVVFVSEAHLARMASAIRIVEQIVALPEYRERVLAYAPAIARHVTAAAGVFLGFDFHLGVDGPRLIEINSNAGGGLLNVCLLRAQRSCCPALNGTVPLANNTEAMFVAMFNEEWRLAGRQRAGRRLHSIAIVDASPDSQYLAPEFALFSQLFAAAGLTVMIADPRELSFAGERLWYRRQEIDLVYNRLTDFALEEPENALLRAAYLADAVVLTPHPRTHALYADKRNLVALGDAEWLQRIGVAPQDRESLAAIVPTTLSVDEDNADALWASRKRWYFKPAAGFGSKATYSGEKMTRRVFDQVRQGGYIAQEVVAPSERRLQVDGVARNFKLDLRNYVYRGNVQLVSARLYRGQTTNFRTPGGGFATVCPVPCHTKIGESG